MRHIAKLRKWFGDSSIVLKLCLAFLIAIFLPLLAFIFSNNAFNRSMVMEQSEYTYNKVLDQEVSYLNARTRIVKNIVDMLCGDQTIQGWGALYSPRKQNTVGNWIVSNDQSDEIIFGGLTTPYISRVYLYLGAQSHAFESTAAFWRLSASQRNSFSAWRSAQGFGGCWLTSYSQQLNSQTQYISYVAKIPDQNKLGSIIGIIRADLPLQHLNDMLRQAGVTPSAKLMLIDGQGEVFVSHGALDAGRQQMAREALPLLAMGRPLALISVGGDMYLAAARTIQYADWTLLFMIPHDEILAVATASRNMMLFDILILLFFALPLIYFLVRSVTKRLRMVRTHMRSASDNDFRANIPEGSNDEIGQLIHSYNRMLTETRDLMSQQYRMGQALKSAEMHVLQEQINPHFLYNTLDLIHWMALRSGAKDIVSVVNDLSSFYRLSLASGEEMVTLERELMHIRAYVSIQNVRFNGNIKLTIDVPEELWDTCVPKIVLQPLVENAISHGIRERDDEKGEVRVTGYASGNDLVLSISDDGVGMCAEKLAEVLSSGNGAHYGVRNTNERLTLHFGQQATLQFSSAPQKGTTVTMRVPRRSSRLNLSQHQKEEQGNESKA